MTPPFAKHARWLVAGVVAASAVLPVATAASAEAAPSAHAQNVYEGKVQRAMNSARTTHGRSALKTSSCANHYAEAWARKIKNRSLKHENMLTILKKCHASVVSENLARGDVSATKMVSLWMHSEGHRKNLLDKKVTRVGTATVWSHGQYTAVTVFVRPL